MSVWGVLAVVSNTLIIPLLVVAGALFAVMLRNIDRAGWGK